MNLPASHPVNAEGLAWLPSDYDYVEPLRAVPLLGGRIPPLWDAVSPFHDRSGALPTCMVVLHHPDAGEIPSRVAEEDLRGPWHEEPSERFSNATGFRPRCSWSTVAERRYAWVQDQRILADRLTALGVIRRRRDYAGHGGSSTTPQQVDTNLTLTHQELELLLGLAERGNT